MINMDTNIDRYKYHNDEEIPFLHRFIYEVKDINYDTLNNLQTKYKLKYIFDDTCAPNLSGPYIEHRKKMINLFGIYTVMNINSQSNWIIGTKPENVELFENFDEMYNKFNNQIKKVFIYEDIEDFDKLLRGEL